MNPKLHRVAPAALALLWGVSASFGQIPQTAGPIETTSASVPQLQGQERPAIRASLSKPLPADAANDGNAVTLMPSQSEVPVVATAQAPTRPRTPGRRPSAPAPGRPRATPPQRPATPPRAPTTERSMQPGAPATESLAGDIGRARSPESVGPFMMGDFITGGSFSGPLMLNCSLQAPYGGGHLAVPYAFHTFKIADNESPWPRNRAFVTTEYFRQVGDTTAITQETLGFERVFNQNRSSIGMRLPFYTVDPGVLSNPLSPSQPVGTFGLGTSTRGNLGDLTLIYKRAVIFDPPNGNVLSVGAAVVAPTGPATLASVTPAYTVNGVYHWGAIQPYMAFYRSIGQAFNGLFLQGFSSIDRPFSAHDATFWYNDFGVGYYYRRDVPRGLTGVVPNFEVHVNTPLGGRTQTVTATPDLAALSGFTSVMGQVQYYNQVNLTSGITFIFNRRTTLALAAVAPVSTPHPFNVEFLAQLNVLRVPWLPAPPP